MIEELLKVGGIAGGCIAMTAWVVKKILNGAARKDEKIMEIFERQDARHEEHRKRWHDIINNHFSENTLTLHKISDNQDLQTKILEKISGKIK